MNGLNGNQNDYPENALVPYPVIDEEIRERLQAKLMRAILTFRAE